MFRSVILGCLLLHGFTCIFLFLTDMRGIIQHSMSKLCMLPKYTDVANNSAVVLTARCSEYLALFRSLADGSLQHASSGMCLGPKDGCLKSLKDTELVLLDQCGKMESEFSFTEKGSLMHTSSRTCARPSSYPVSNKDTTMIVLNSVCDPTKNKFDFVTGRYTIFFLFIPLGIFYCIYLFTKFFYQTRTSVPHAHIITYLQ